MNEVFKLRGIPYYNLGIFTIFLDPVQGVYSSTESVWYLGSKFKKQTAFRQEIKK